MPDPLPAWFIAHGAPTHLLGDQPARRFWQRLAGHLPRPPRAVICLSAHWLTTEPSLAGDVSAPQIQYDFYGFPDQLYDIKWPLTGSPETASWLKPRLHDAIPELREEPDRAFDHGLWVPLMSAWPNPNFPIYQLSLCPQKGTDWHLQLGRQLASLREQDVLIIGSGGLVHNLRRINWHAARGQAEPWANAFMQALTQAILERDYRALCDPWSLPHGRECVPTDEHYLPLLVTLGAGGDGPVVPLYEDWEYGSLALHSYAIEDI